MQTNIRDIPRVEISYYPKPKINPKDRGIEKIANGLMIEYFPAKETIDSSTWNIPVAIYGEDVINQSIYIPTRTQLTPAIKMSLERNLSLNERIKGDVEKIRKIIAKKISKEIFTAHLR